jgi:hypothetical protein
LIFDPVPLTEWYLVGNQAEHNNIMNKNNTINSTDIFYATNHPDQVLERLDEMASNSEDVCLRLEMLESPISVYGIIRKRYEGAYTVESSDEQSHATFSAKQVTSIGSVCIWITL